MTRWGQHGKDVSAEQEPRVWGKIAARAKKFGIAAPADAATAARTVSERIAAEAKAAKAALPLTREEITDFENRFRLALLAPLVSQRYSEDQPRDADGKFGSGGGHSEPIGKTASGKDIPGPGHGVYNDKQNMPKYNGPTSPALAGGRTGGKMLRERLPEFTKQDHLDAAAAHTAAGMAKDKEWGKTADEAAQKTFGRPYEATDYKVSGIASDKFSDADKDKLRDLAHTSTDHMAAASAHLYASQYMRQK
jgi:hypothetical protein